MVGMTPEQPPAPNPLAEIPRSMATLLNPVICDISAQGTMRNVAELVGAAGNAVMHDDAAEDLAPLTWRITQMAKAALLYEASAVP